MAPMFLSSRTTVFCASSSSCSIRRRAAERFAAFADFFAHDEPDFAGWCDKVRRQAQKLYPADVRLVETQEALRENLADADALIVESLAVGAADIAAAPQLKAVQKFGVDLRRIDAKACGARNVAVLTIRRRANIACAELALTLMLMLARRVNEFHGRISAKALAALGYAYRPFDRRHTPNSNWGRITGLSILHGSTVGIVGLGRDRPRIRRARRGIRHAHPLYAAATGARGDRAALPGDLPAVAGIARGKRLGRAVRTGRAGDAKPHRPRRTRAHAAGRAARSTFRAPRWSTARR